MAGSSSWGILAICVLTLAPSALRSQSERASQSRQEEDVATLLSRHLAAVDEYRRAFANLIGDELHVIEVFKENGKREAIRTLESDLLVYASPRDADGDRAEYREVRTVDGKRVKRRGERLGELLSRASEAESLSGELETINAATAAYEFSRHVRGFTMNQGSPDDLRRGFRIELAGRDQIAGRDVIVLAYRQTEWTSRPRNRLLPPLPPEFGDAQLISQGRLWIDAANAQLWRSVWELVAPHPDAAVPLVMVHAESSYVPSGFGILVPERIMIEWRDTFKHPRNGPPQFLVKQRDTFSYGEFHQFQATARVVP